MKINITNTKSLNIVTGFWNFIPNRPEGMYLDNMKNILLLNHNITVFVPKKYEEFILEARCDKLDKTDIIITELDDIKNKYFYEYYNKVESIRTNSKWYNSLSWLKHVPQGFSNWYNPVVMSKVFLMYESYKRNTFNSDTFVWIDAGITRHISPQLISDDIFQNMSMYIKNVLFHSYNYTGGEVHGFNYDGFVKYTESTPPGFNCRGAIIGCDKNYMNSFKNEYSYYLNDTLDSGYLGTEESIFSLLSCVNPISYDRIHTPNSPLQNTFLEKMKTQLYNE